MGQGAGEQADDEWGWGADDVEHGRGQNGDVSVLPNEGVEQCNDCMAALGESTAKRMTKRNKLGKRTQV